MIKLYKTKNSRLHYSECWIDGKIATIHTGIVGNKGESEEIRDVKDENGFLANFQKVWMKKGYALIPEEQQSLLVLQWPMKTLTGSTYNHSIRNHAEALLNEHLGWLGLGHVDGFDMGRTSNPKEEFALNIFCKVVDDKIAVESIVKMLPLQLDCSRLKIATRRIGDENFTLQYSAKEKEKTFYL